MQLKLFLSGCEKLSVRAQGSEPDQLYHSAYFVAHFSIFD